MTTRSELRKGHPRQWRFPHRGSCDGRGSSDGGNSDGGCCAAGCTAYHPGGVVSRHAGFGPNALLGRRAMDS
jgi:hypothetical protein